MNRNSLIKLLALLLISCDPITEIEIDKNYSFNTNCGSVEMSGVKFQTSTLLIDQVFMGNNFSLDLNEIKHQIIPPEGNEVVDMSLLKDGFEIEQSKMDIQNEEIVLKLMFREKIDKGDVVFVLPCDYIKCEATPLISDTIRITL